MLRPVCGTVRSRRTVLLGRELRVPPRRVRHDGVRRTVVPRAVRGTEELHRNAGTGHPAGGRRTASYPQTTPRQHGTGRRPYRASYPSYPFPQNWRRTVVVPVVVPLAIEAGPTTGLWGSPGSNPSRLPSPPVDYGKNLK
jgi:hypothetical protein